MRYEIDLERIQRQKSKNLCEKNLQVGFGLPLKVLDEFGLEDDRENAFRLGLNYLADGTRSTQLIAIVLK